MTTCSYFVSISGDPLICPETSGVDNARCLLCGVSLLMDKGFSTSKVKPIAEKLPAPAGE